VFALREDQLDWEIVGKWSLKDYDFDYAVMVKRRDYCTQGMAFVEYTSDPYDVFIHYIVKARELLIYSRRWDAKDSKLGFKKIFSLDEIWIGTEQVLRRDPPPFWNFWSFSDRAAIVGEKFFFSDPELTYRTFRRSAFVLLYPERSWFYACDCAEAVSFSSKLKSRIGNEVADPF
jgi:hypothetical protein